MVMIRIGLLVLLAAISMPAAAYIGPGSGISLLGGIWTLLVGFVLVLAAILFWPIRYLIKRIRARKNAERATGTDDRVRSDGDHQ